MKKGKRYKEALSLFDKTKTYEQSEALDIVTLNLVLMVEMLINK